MNVNRIRSTLIFACASLALPWISVPALAQDQAVSIFIVRHAESDNKQPTVPLSKKGLERAALLAPTVRGIKFTHLFASHTTRARQMLEEVSAASRLPIVQLPTPGSTLDGQVVNDQTTRRAPIEPISDALLKLPPGSVALVALNSENIYAILNKLGVPVAKAGQGCAQGSTCVPCTDNSCYPRDEYNHLWHVVRVPGKAEPVAFAELRYGEGWKPANPQSMLAGLDEDITAAIAHGAQVEIDPEKKTIRVVQAKWDRKALLNERLQDTR